MSAVSAILRRPLVAFGILLVVIHCAVAVAASWIVPNDPFQLLAAPLEPPSAAFPLGTDELGRDFLSRLLVGGRIAIFVAFAAGFVAAFGGCLLGLAAAYYRGALDDVVSRVVEVKLAFPAILFVALFVTGFGQSIAVLILVIAVIKMMGVIRTSRAQGLVLMQQGYVKAAQLRGEPAWLIILAEMLPNALDLLTVEFALRSSSALLLISSLSFLGLGISPPTPDWGLMIHDALSSIRTEPWLILAPALCISTLVVGINLATEGIADALGLDAARGTTGH